MNGARIGYLLLGVTLWSASGRADAPPSCGEGEIACGRTAFARGTEAFDRRDYLNALTWFSAAAKANAHPVVVFNLALTEARLERFVSAAERFEALLALDSLDPPLRQRVERELLAAEAGIARVTFELPNPVGSRTFLDGAVVTSPGDEILVDPGKHRLVVENDGDVVFDQELDLMRGERVRLRVGSRTRAIDVVVVSPENRAVVASPVAARGERGASPVWFYAAAAGTVALGAASIWSGVDTQNAYDDYRADLPRLDQAEADRRVEDGHGRERRTNLLLGATALAAAGTAVLGLFVVDWSSDDRPGSGASVVLTPLGAVASGRF